MTHRIKITRWNKTKKVFEFITTFEVKTYSIGSEISELLTGKNSPYNVAVWQEIKNAG